MQSTFEKLGGTYRQKGDYLLPNVKAPESPAIGVWGQRRHKYLVEHNHALYTALLLSGKLTTHLEEMLMYGKVSQENYVELTAASAIPNKEIKSPQILRY